MTDLYDPREQWASYLINAIKAKELQKRDVNYIVKGVRTFPAASWGKHLSCVLFSLCHYPWQSCMVHPGAVIEDLISGVVCVCLQNEIIIVDEFTGRTMPGRRWGDGLHQAVEAKEGVPIQDETVTLASISYQVHPSDC